MARTGWSIRFYDVTNDDYPTIDIVGNFQNYGNRQNDEIVTFNGIYGLDNYMTWEIHKNIGSYDFDSVGINLRLFLDMDKKRGLFEDFYRVVEVKYDMSRSKYILYAVSEDTIKLRSPLADYRIESLSYKEGRSAKDVLVEVLEGKNIFSVFFFEGDTKYDYEYRMLTFDPTDSVYDFINKICSENLYEWYVDDGTLFVGKELRAMEKKNSTYIDTRLTENESESYFFKKISGKTRPLDVMSHIDKVWKCMWAKHSVGVSGGLTKGCFTRIGKGGINRDLYFGSLENAIERENATRLSRQIYYNFTTIGSITKDEGEKFIDEISVQRNFELRKTRTPNDVVIDKGKDSSSETQIKQLKEKTCRTTPYLDDSAGLLFPVPKFEKTPPNVVIHNIDGREEASVIGNFIFGNGDKEFIIPKKNKDDFRLQFPSGWCLYVKEDGETYLQIDSVDPETVDPQNETNKVFLRLKPDGTVKINQGSGNWIQIDSSGNITIDGSTVKIQGGGHKLAHANHTHTLTAMHVHPTTAPGVPTGPPTGQDSATACTDNTITTEAD